MKENVLAALLQEPNRAQIDPNKQPREGESGRAGSEHGVLR